MKFDYSEICKLTEKVGNNALSWELRKKGDHLPILTIPRLKKGKIEDVTLGEDIVFEEYENGEILSCVGLKDFIETELSTIPVIIFDNHNHALYFWIREFQRGNLESGFELIHMDEHSDLWENEHILDLETARKDREYAWKFTNQFCNVGNYIIPAIKSGFIGKMIRIENEFQIDQHLNYSPSYNSVLNLDLDIFAPEMDFIDSIKKIAIIKKILPQVRLITIATSPYFIEQKKAIKILQEIFSKLEKIAINFGYSGVILSFSALIHIF